MTDSSIVPATPEARRDAIRHGLETIAPIIIEAYHQRDWEHFGYGSWHEYLTSEFGGPLRLGRGERQDVVGQLRQEGLSQRAIGDALGVDPATVNRDLSSVANATVDTPDTITGLDGKERAATRPHVSNNSGENEWYTPPEIIQAATEVMDAIDLDPASSAAANAQIQAASYFDKDDDGLSQQWHGRVWLNPPYSSDLVRRFAEKLCDEYIADHVTEACLLSNNATETKWFQRTAVVANRVCFPEGRLSYWHPDRTSKTPLQGQAILYFGASPSRFESVFRRFGVVLRT